MDKVYARVLKLNPGGVPRWWRFYDNGGEYILVRGMPIRLVR